MSVRDCLECLNWHKRVQSTVSQCSFLGREWSSQRCIRKLVKPKPLSQPEGEPAGHGPCFSTVSDPDSCHGVLTSHNDGLCPFPYKLIWSVFCHSNWNEIHHNPMKLALVSFLSVHMALKPKVYCWAEKLRLLWLGYTAQMEELLEYSGCKDAARINIPYLQSLKSE